MQKFLHKHQFFDQTQRYCCSFFKSSSSHGVQHINFFSVRHFNNEQGRNHSCITLVRHSSNESSNNTHIQCWITRAKIRKKPNLSLFYFFFGETYQERARKYHAHKQFCLTSVVHFSNENAHIENLSPSSQQKGQLTPSGGLDLATLYCPGEVNYS